MPAGDPMLIWHRTKTHVTTQITRWHLMRTAFYLCRLPLQIHDANLTMRKPSDKSQMRVILQKAWTNTAENYQAHPNMGSLKQLHKDDLGFPVTGSHRPMYPSFRALCKYEWWFYNVIDWTMKLYALWRQSEGLIYHWLYPGRKRILFHWINEWIKKSKKASKLSETRKTDTEMYCEMFWVRKRTWGTH